MSEVDLRKAIFLINSPQEAIAMMLIGEGREIENCILVSYIGYADGQYTENVLNILNTIQIKNLFRIDLYLHNLSIDKGNYFKSIIQIIINKYRISKFNKKYYEGKLYSKYYSFITQIDNPLITLSFVKEEKILMLEHSPTDSRARLLKSKNLDILETKKSTLNFISVLNFFRKIPKAIFIRMLYFIFPMHRKMPLINRGFSWIPHEDNFYLLDYKNFNANNGFKLKSIVNDWIERDVTVLLVDHQSEYATATYFNEMKSVDFVEMYVDIVKRNVKRNEILLCKLHPYIVQNLPGYKIKEYQDELQFALHSQGYVNTFFLSDLLCEKWQHLVPVELIIVQLGVSKIIALYSSTLLIAAQWGGIRLISACSQFPGLDAERRKDKNLNIFKMDGIEFQ